MDTHNESPEFNLTRDQKSRLLSLGLDSEPREPAADPEEHKADVLCDILTRRLPADPLVVDSLPAVLKNLAPRLHSLAGEPIGDLLQSPTTDIHTIRKIKQHAKQLGTSADSEAESDIFLVIYYAAIAAALISHDERITQHTYEDLEQFFSSFMKKNWVPEELKGLFTRAREYSCTRRPEDKIDSR
jgi:hypothetical protein